MLNLLLASLIHHFDWKLFPDRMAPEGINAKDKFGLTLQKALPLVAIPVVVAKVEQFMDLFPCYTMLLVMLQVVIRQFAIAELSVNFWVNLMLPGARHFHL